MRCEEGHELNPGEKACEDVTFCWDSARARHGRSSPGPAFYGSGGWGVGALRRHSSLKKTKEENTEHFDCQQYSPV